MFKNLLQVYALLVCLINTVFLLIMTCWGLNSITDLAMPEYKNYSRMLRYVSDENYKDYFQDNYSNQNYYDSNDSRRIHNETRLKEFQQLTPEKLTERRINDRNNFLENNRRNAIEGLIRSLQWLLVSLFFFAIHWRLYRRAAK